MDGRSPELTDVVLVGAVVTSGRSAELTLVVFVADPVC